jgi:glutathione synthase
MKLLFVADPLEGFKTYKDSTFAMMRAAAARGHALHACEARELQWQRGGKVGGAGARDRADRRRARLVRGAARLGVTAPVALAASMRS